jgi:hypothetical protein
LKFPNLKFTRTQGSNTLRWHLGPAKRCRVPLKLMIKEDHLLACTTRMFEIQIALPFLRLSREREPRKSNDLDRSDNYCCTQQFLSTHPRGCPTIHLSKSLLQQSASNNFRRLRRVFPTIPFRCSRVGEANTIVRFLPVNGSFRFSFRRLCVALPSGYDVTWTPPKQQPSDDKISGQVNYHLGKRKAAPIIQSCTGKAAGATKRGNERRKLSNRCS